MVVVSLVTLCVLHPASNTPHTSYISTGHEARGQGLVINNDKGGGCYNTGGGGKYICEIAIRSSLKNTST